MPSKDLQSLVADRNSFLKASTEIIISNNFGKL